VRNCRRSRASRNASTWASVSRARIALRGRPPRSYAVPYPVPVPSPRFTPLTSTAIAGPPRSALHSAPWPCAGWVTRSRSGVNKYALRRHPSLTRSPQPVSACRSGQLNRLRKAFATILPLRDDPRGGGARARHRRYASHHPPVRPGDCRGHGEVPLVSRAAISQLSTHQLLPAFPR
jgi:hypothetical protein